MRNTIMAYIAEIFTEHPTQTVIDQVDRLYAQKGISASDYQPLLSTIREAQAQLDDPTTDYLEVQLSDRRLVKVSKFQAPRGFAEGQRVRIAKRDLSPQEEMEARAAALPATPGLTHGQKLDRVAKADPDLWARYIAAQRKGEGSHPVAKAVAPSRDTILKMAEGLVAEAKAGTKLAALAQLVQDHPTERAFYDTYRDYQLGQGLDDHIQRSVAS
jgi:hypothetical protein